MGTSAAVETVIRDVARNCGALVIECADVGGYVTAVSERMDQTIADLDRFDAVAAALSQDQASVAQSIDRAQRLSEDVKDKLTQGKVSIIGSVAGFQDLTALVQELSGGMERIVEALDQVQQVSQMIGGIAKQTNMLALNAAIEAARAGEAGQAFAVVATEVKKLAQITRDATERIDQTLTRLADEASSFSNAIDHGVQEADLARGKINALEKTVDDIGSIVALVDEQTEGMARSTEQMHASISAVQREMAASASATRANGHVLRSARVRLDGLESDANMMLDQLASSGVEIDDTPLINLAVAVAKEISEVVDAALSRGAITLDDVFDAEYQPVPGTNPLQHTTRFNGFADMYIRPILDRVMLATPRSIGCVISDNNGYLPTHLSLRSQPQGNDVEWNNTWSRNRRQMGLDDATARAIESDAPSMLNCYRMTLGNGDFLPVKNVFVPVYFGGHRWGNCELAYVDQISAAAESITAKALAKSLASLRGDGLKQAA